METYFLYMFIVIVFSVYLIFLFIADSTSLVAQLILKKTETVINYKSVTDKCNNIPLHKYELFPP